MPDMTVIVASHNRRDALLRSLPHHQAPVILVDNGSDDDTASAVAAAYPHVRIVRLAENIGAAARNVGVQLADTPYVAFADDDSYWEDGSLRRAAAFLAAYPRAGLLTARVLVGREGRLDPISAYMSTAPLGTRPDLPGPSVLGFLACAAVVRRAAFLSVGGFAAPLHVYGEEALLAMDLAADGWGLSYLPSLTVRHLPTPAGRNAAARARREVRNRLLTTWLRRPAGIAARAALNALTDPRERPGLLAALGELGWVLRDRRPLPANVEADLATLEADWIRYHSTGRRTAPAPQPAPAPAGAAPSPAAATLSPADQGLMHVR